MSNEQKAYKDEVKEWLKQRNLSVAWLASWAGKSEGTVKNWLYGKVLINKNNKHLISDIMARFEEGLISLSLNDSNVTSQFVSTPASCYLGYFDEDTMNVVSNALSIPLSCFPLSAIDDVDCTSQWEKERNYNKIVQWTTRVIDEVVKEKLTHLKNSYEQAGCRVSVAALPCSKFSETETKGNIISGTPVITIQPHSLNTRFIAIASAYDKEPNATAWVNQILRKKAAEELDNEFLDYLNSNKTDELFGLDEEIPF